MAKIKKKARKRLINYFKTYVISRRPVISEEEIPLKKGDGKNEKGKV